MGCECGRHTKSYLFPGRKPSPNSVKWVGGFFVFMVDIENEKNYNYLMPKATNICAAEAKEIKYLPNNTVLISINEPDGDLYTLKLDRNSSKILTVRFPDITAKIEVKGRLYLPINDEIALNILDFINRNIGKDFIVNCAAGVSRSSAICLYLHLFHGYELKPRFWQLSNPNKYVMGQLIFSRHCDRWKRD